MPESRVQLRTKKHKADPKLDPKFNIELENKDENAKQIEELKVI